MGMQAYEKAMHKLLTVITIIYLRIAQSVNID